MPFDERVADQVRQLLASRGDVSERHNFINIPYFVAGGKNLGVTGGRLLRYPGVGPTQYQAALRRPHASEMRFTGRPTRGYVTVEPPGYSTKKALAAWVAAALTFVTSLPPK